MSWPSDVPPELRRLAEEVLTPAQLEVVILKAAGWSERSMARQLRLSRGAIRDRLDSAERKLSAAIEEAAN